MTKIRASSARVAAMRARVLAEFVRQSRDSRRRLFDYFDSLPTPLGSAAAAFYRTRVARAKGRPLLGEYLPWLTADLRGIGASTAEPIVLPWLLLYAHILAVDDLIDRRGEQSLQFLPIVAGLLAQRAFSEYRHVFADNRQFWEHFDKFCLETGVAGINEVERTREPVGSPRKGEVSELGRKLALIKLCSVSVALSCGLPPPTRTQLEALDALATGVQLLDDVTDWAEDYEAGAWTPLLGWTIARAGLPRSDLGAGSRRLTNDELLLYMIETGSLTDCLIRSDAYLSRAATQGWLTNRGLGARLISIILHDARWLRRHTERVRVVIERERTRSGESDSAKLLTKSKRLRRAIAEAQKSIQVVAQQS